MIRSLVAKDLRVNDNMLTKLNTVKSLVIQLVDISFAIPFNWLRKCDLRMLLLRYHAKCVVALILLHLVQRRLLIGENK